MTNSTYDRLEDVILDEAFPDVDLALRRGRHVDRDDGPWYAFLTEAQEKLETFYRRFDCELIHKNEGYFYLLPSSDRLGRRHLSPGEMLVGQAVTLLYLDPHTVQSGGLATREQVLSQLASVLGADALIRALNPKRRRHDPRVAEETVRSKVAEALRRLASLGFVELVDESVLRLRPALMRFAEPVRGTAAPDAALGRLMATGELVLLEAEEEGVSADIESEEAVPDSDPRAAAEEWNGIGSDVAFEPSPATTDEDEP